MCVPGVCRVLVWDVSTTCTFNLHNLEQTNRFLFRQFRLPGLGLFALFIWKTTSEDSSTRFEVLSYFISDETCRTLDETYLGCSLCMKSESKKKRGFASGRYEVKKYFNQRTLQQHVDSPIHQTCLGKAKSSPSQPQDLVIVASSPSRPSSDKDPATPPRRMPSQSSKQATPSTSGKKETQTRRSFYNLMRGVYTTLHQCLSSCVFRILLSFAEACGGSCHSNSPALSSRSVAT